MSIIKPFRGIRYARDAEGGLSRLIAPPYDVISEEERKSLAAKSPHNIVRLILPEGAAEGQRDRYTIAGETWRHWQDRGVLARDKTPAIYRYNMSFEVKTPEGIETRERPGFVASLKLCEYDEEKVLPHERTMKGPKEDRFKLILASRAQFSQIFMLYRDPEANVDSALDSAPAEGKMECEDDAGVTHTMWPVTDPEVIDAVTSAIGEGPVYIADGHHRYETSLAINRFLNEKTPLFTGESDRVMAYFTPAPSEGLVVFPYHRLIKGLPKRRMSGLRKRLEELFRVEPALMSPLDPGPSRREFVSGLTEHGKNGPVFGMVDASGKAYYLALKEGTDLYRSCESEVEMVLCGLDVVVLEDLVLIAKLGMKHKDLISGKYVSYETDYDRVLDRMREDGAQLAFLVNPTPVEDVLKVADLHGTMPEKSTYFFPKLATGLVMNSID